MHGLPNCSSRRSDCNPVLGIILEERQQSLGYPSNIRFPQDRALTVSIKRAVHINYYRHSYSMSYFGPADRINHMAQGVNSAPPPSEPILVFMEWFQPQAFLDRTIKRMLPDSMLSFIRVEILMDTTLALLGSDEVLSDFTDQNPTVVRLTINRGAPGPLSNYCRSTPASFPM